MAGRTCINTESFRVHGDSRLEKWILESITQNPSGRPVVAQMIGNGIPALVRTARELQRHPIAASDLNLGCPAPVVDRKCAGGGLLRDLRRVDGILGALREPVRVKFTVAGVAQLSTFLKQRLDQLLVARGCFESREKAQRAIMAGVVAVGEQCIDKAGTPIAEDAAITVNSSERDLGRGGLKLEAALARFAIDPPGATCLDIGASTGGSRSTASMTKWTRSSSATRSRRSGGRSRGAGGQC